jgi:hypothetical protein
MRNDYEEKHGMDYIDPTMDEMWEEHVRGKVCPECGGELYLSASVYALEVECEDCAWGKEVL